MKKILIMCIGNREGGDDSVGPYIADKLKDTDIEVIDCGTTPESYTSIVKKSMPDKLFIIDAADMGLESGEIRIIPKEKIGVMHISTHGIPISVIIGYLERYVKKIIFIGIQPEKMSGDISIVVKKSGDNLVKLIVNENLQIIKILE